MDKISIGLNQIYKMNRMIVFSVVFVTLFFGQHVSSFELSDLETHLNSNQKAPTNAKETLEAALSFLFHSQNQDVELERLHDQLVYLIDTSSHGCTRSDLARHQEIYRQMLDNGVSQTGILWRSVKHYISLHMAKCGASYVLNFFKEFEFPEAVEKYCLLLPYNSNLCKSVDRQIRDSNKYWQYACIKGIEEAKPDKQLVNTKEVLTNYIKNGNVASATRDLRPTPHNIKLAISDIKEKCETFLKQSEKTANQALFVDEVFDRLSEIAAGPYKKFKTMIEQCEAFKGIDALRLAALVV